MLQDVKGLGLMCLLAMDEWQPIHMGRLASAIDDLPQMISADIVPHEAGPDEAALGVTVDRQEFVVVTMPGSMPEEAFAKAVESSVFWPAAREKLDGHRAFAAITAAETEQTPGLVRAQAIAMTRLAAAVAATVPSLGLCWCSAQTAVPASKIRRAVDQIADGMWPVDMWVGYDVFFGPGDQRNMIGASTRGAADYLGCELTVSPMRSTPEIPLRVLSESVSHLIGQGMYLRDGQELVIKGVSHARWQIDASGSGAAIVKPALR